MYISSAGAVGIQSPACSSKWGFVYGPDDPQDIKTGRGQAPVANNPYGREESP
jgi:hypothetical protein